jgi:hypothetical protein
MRSWNQEQPGGCGRACDFETHWASLSDADKQVNVSGLTSKFHLLDFPFIAVQRADECFGISPTFFLSLYDTDTIVSEKKKAKMGAKKTTGMYIPYSSGSSL